MSADASFDPGAVIVPADSNHPAIIQAELDAILLQLVDVEGELAPLCRHAAVVLAMMARHIHQTRPAAGQQLH